MRRVLYGAALLTFGICAFLATSAAIRALLPWPAEGSLAARWRHFRANAGDYDLVFVGSSNIARSIDPVAFDRELARLGRPLRSYNLAADDMQSAEVGHLLRQVVAQRVPRLRYAVIELVDFAPREMLRRNPFTDRAVSWHDCGTLRDALRLVAASSEPRREKLRLGWLHLRHAAWRAANFGRALRAIRASWTAADPTDLAVAEAGGFEALELRPDPSSLEWHAKFLASLPSYRAQLADVDRRNRVPALAPPGLARVVREQTAWLRAAGIEPIYLVPPVPWPVPELLAIAREPVAAAVVVLGSPGRFPELFDPEHRWDAMHVNSAGAAAMSVLVASEIAPKLAAPARD